MSNILLIRGVPDTNMKLHNFDFMTGNHFFPELSWNLFD